VRLRERCEATVQLDLKAAGQCGPASVTCGRRELIPAGERAAAVLQEFHVMVPIEVTVMAERCDTHERWSTNCSFTVMETVVVEIPLSFGAEGDQVPTEPSTVSGSCRSTFAAMVEAKLPMEFQVVAGCDLRHVHG
jgi:hypothetical protein